MQTGAQEETFSIAKTGGDIKNSITKAATK